MLRALNLCQGISKLLSIWLFHLNVACQVQHHFGRHNLFSLEKMTQLQEVVQGAYFIYFFLSEGNHFCQWHFFLTSECLRHTHLENFLSRLPLPLPLEPLHHSLWYCGSGKGMTCLDTSPMVPSALGILLHVITSTDTNHIYYSHHLSMFIAFMCTAWILTPLASSILVMELASLGC